MQTRAQAEKIRRNAELTRRAKQADEIKTDADLARYIFNNFGIVIPDKPQCPNHCAPFTAFADAYFARGSTTVWKASRGFGGKTFMLGLLALVEATILKANVNLLGGSGEQSQRVLEHIARFWNHPNAPRQLLSSDVSREMRFTHGNKIEALMASQRSARGAHPQRLRLDEIDEMDLAILDAATGQPMESGTGIATQTVMSSTHQYTDGAMTEILRRAADKGWKVYEWCYRENLEPRGWLTQAEVERKRGDVTATMWDSEYELQEPSPESRAIMPDAIKAMFKRELGEFAGEARQYIEIESPQPGATYAHGADWAASKDWTIIWTLRTDVRPMRFIAFERLGREPYPAMIARLQERIQRFGGNTCHDATGLGDVVDDLLAGEAQVTGFKMVGQARADLLSNYIKAIENGDIESPFIRYAEQEHRLASRADVFQSGAKYHLPDTISAGALAIWAAQMPKHVSMRDVAGNDKQDNRWSIERQRKSNSDDEENEGGTSRWDVRG